MDTSGVVRTFTNVAQLIEWLEDRNWDCGSPEAFNEWLQDFFENGNEIQVHGESYDYMSCRELV